MEEARKNVVGEKLQQWRKMKKEKNTGMMIMMMIT